MKKIILIAIFSHCLLSFSQKDSVIFMGIDSYFVFYSDSTYKLYYLPCDICPEFADNNNLISFGSYSRYKNKALYLYSDRTLDEITMTVSESKESIPYLLFYINMPAQEDSTNILRPHYFYSLTVSYKIIKEDSIVYFKKDFYQNDPKFIIPIDSACMPINFIVKVYPKSSAKGMPYAQQKYIPSKDNNVFIITFPQFVSGFLDYRRMYHYRLDIFNKKIIGDSFLQNVYIRNDVYSKKHYSDWYFPICPSWQYKTKPSTR